jgi:alginate O-acetyltransferase complex protein AlgI
MLFPTTEFAIFFGIVFPITWWLNDRNETKKWFLVLVSYLFYSFWDWRFLFLLFGSSVVSYAAGLAIAAARTERGRRLVVGVAVAVNLAVLAYFKYVNFFIASAVNLLDSLGIQVASGFVEVTLPVAISFLTFHAISYVVDVYRGAVQPTRSLVDLLFYIAFFPHLVAGPIVRASEFLWQASSPRTPHDIRLGAAALLIVGGVFKKVVVANYIATEYVDRIFLDPSLASPADLWLGMYAYALQIYCDFSAYTDIAIGIASLLGYQFPQNFNQPYRALSMRDFWQRWHITLSRWLRDYLYIPLGGNRFGPLLTYRNLMITMLLGGLWHGAAMTFVVWGLIHGAALCLERALGFADDTPRSRLTQVLRWLVTFHVVCFAWIFFRSQTLEGALAYIARMFSFEAGAATVTPFVAAMLVLGALTQIVPARWSEALAAWYERVPLTVRVAVPFLAIYLTSVAGPEGVAPFIYFQF